MSEFPERYDTKCATVWRSIAEGPAPKIGQLIVVKCLLGDYYVGQYCEAVGYSRCINWQTGESRHSWTYWLPIAEAPR